jgi:hypothetical protein
MNFVGAFFRTVGLFWGIAIIVIVLGGGAILGLVQAGYFLDTQNANHQAAMANKQYQIQRNTQAYQDTYVQQTDKAYQQLKTDMWNTASAAQQGDKTMVTMGNAEIKSDVTMFCGDAQKLTATSLDSLGPNELAFYQKHC